MTEPSLVCGQQDYANPFFTGWSDASELFVGFGLARMTRHSCLHGFQSPFVIYAKAQCLAILRKKGALVGQIPFSLHQTRHQVRSVIGDAVALISNSLTEGVSSAMFDILDEKSGIYYSVLSSALSFLIKSPQLILLLVNRGQRLVLSKYDSPVAGISTSS